jgi:hypothetical protein
MIAKFTLRCHERDPEYCFLSKEQNPIWFEIYTNGYNTNSEIFYIKCNYDVTLIYLKYITQNSKHCLHSLAPCHKYGCKWSATCFCFESQGKSHWYWADDWLGSTADPNATVKRKIPVRFQVPTAVTMKITNCWYETVGSLVANCHNFGETLLTPFVSWRQR